MSDDEGNTHHVGSFDEDEPPSSRQTVSNGEYTALARSAVDCLNRVRTLSENLQVDSVRESFEAHQVLGIGRVVYFQRLDIALNDPIVNRTPPGVGIPLAADRRPKPDEIRRVAECLDEKGYKIDRDTAPIMKDLRSTKPKARWLFQNLEWKPNWAVIAIAVLIVVLIAWVLVSKPFETKTRVADRTTVVTQPSSPVVVQQPAPVVVNPKPTVVVQNQNPNLATKQEVYDTVNKRAEELKHGLIYPLRNRVDVLESKPAQVVIRERTVTRPRTVTRQGGNTRTAVTPLTPEQQRYATQFKWGRQ